MTCLDCKEREAHSRGLCGACYHRNRKAGTLNTYPLVRVPTLPVVEGASYRQLDHWVRLGYLRLGEPTPGSGRFREWPEDELKVAAMMARLCAAGITPAAAERVARNGPELAPGVRVVIDA